MAVNSIVFGGVDSADYGIYISGEGVFNAPKRDVEMIEIPGRNGAFALDNGRFENIEVTYPAFNFEPDDYESFAQNLSDFRNALCSLTGYQRLTDSFHPDEYRMAVYKEGLEVKPVKYNTASEFSIVFDCKPQRFLTSGETAVSVDSGDTLTNPTLFEASPLLEVEGYGDIGIGGEMVTIRNETLGQVQVYAGGARNFTRGWWWYPTLDVSQLNTGDDIYFPSLSLVFNVTTTSTDTSNPVTGVADASLQSQVNIETSSESVVSSTTGRFSYTLPAYTFHYGTSETAPGSSAESIAIHKDGSMDSADWSFTLSYDGNNKIHMDMSVTRYTCTTAIEAICAPIIALSTKSALGNPNYIDLDIGEAWKEEGGEIISINNVVELPANLPTLKSGSNSITFDNTITSLKIVPRWWKI